MKYLLCAISVFLAMAQPAEAARLPEKIGYTVYSAGTRVGHTDITVTRKGDVIVFESSSLIDQGGGQFHRTECRTEVDGKSFFVRNLRYEGDSGPAAFKGEFTVDHFAIVGATYSGDEKMPKATRTKTEQVMVLQDFVFEHYVAMALAHDAHKELVLNAELFLPNAMNIAQLTITATGEAEVESEYGAAVARKLIVQFTGASPFAIYFDQTRGLPVYMAFPQTGIEAFLDEFYMDKPVSRLRRRSTE